MTTENCFLPTEEDLHTYDQDLVVPSVRKLKNIFLSPSKNLKLKHNPNCINPSLCEIRSLPGHTPLCGGTVPYLGSDTFF